MILITKDSNNKIRVVEISVAYNKTQDCYIIQRQTGIFGGKQTIQPEIIIKEGKAKRTLKQQAKLEFESHINKYLNKGYKIYDKLTNIEFDKISTDQLHELLGFNKTDNTGSLKPMLAKDINKCSISTIDRIEYWWGSRKLDGVRVMMKYDPDKDMIKTSSRGGKDYFESTLHLTTDPILCDFFKEFPNIILDGELYIHGYSLQEISGLARRQDFNKECKNLEFWIFDTIDLDNIDKTFEDRRVDLLDFNEFWKNHKKFNSESKFKFVDHEKVSGYLEINNRHDKYVNEGFEGIVIRDPNKSYGIGKRDNSMLKIKNYQDDEFEITGMKEGLREEDFVFTCLTKEGYEFCAKPIGSREIKEKYRNDISNIIGKFGTVKFFNYSDLGIPTQPVLKVIRDYE